ncbi:MAG: roadblock/LC7 domain-containing protein [Methylococcales bacterium]
MHWFESEIEELVTLSNKYDDHRALQTDASSFDREPDSHRGEFVAALNKIVSNVAIHSGVSGCLISCDGLVMAMAGEAPDFEALAAITQECVAAANKGAKLLNLGELQQMVVVGATHKIAVVTIGEMALCVLSPRATSLSASLSESA